MTGFSDWIKENLLAASGITGLFACVISATDDIFLIFQLSLAVFIASLTIICAVRLIDIAIYNYKH